MNSPDVWRNMDYERPFSMEDVREDVARSRAEGVPFTIEADGRPIGRIGLNQFRRRDRIAAMYLYIGDPDAAGHGYAIEAIDVLLGFAFERFDLWQVELWTLADNQKAIHVYTKCGFVEEAHPARPFVEGRPLGRPHGDERQPRRVREGSERTERAVTAEVLPDRVAALLGDHLRAEADEGRITLLGSTGWAFDVLVPSDWKETVAATLEVGERSLRAEAFFLRAPGGGRRRGVPGAPGAEPAAGPVAVRRVGHRRRVAGRGGAAGGRRCGGGRPAAGWAGDAHRRDVPAVLPPSVRDVAVRAGRARRSGPRCAPSVGTGSSTTPPDR